MKDDRKKYLDILNWLCFFLYYYMYIYINFICFFMFYNWFFFLILDFDECVSFLCVYGICID